MVRRVAEPQSQVVTTRQLTDLGADRAWVARQVRSGMWQRLHQGVLVTHSGPIGWRSRAWGALLYAGPGAALSHTSAAYLHEFTTAPGRPIEVSIPDTRRVAPSNGVMVHVRAVMPPTSGRPRKIWPADTAVDLVSTADNDDDAIGWLCDAVRAGCSALAIREALARRTPPRNVALLRELLADVGHGIESPLERRYHRDVERRHGLPAARLQVRQVVDGQWIRADGIYEGLGVRIELDGGLAHPRGRTDRDTWRDNAVLLDSRELTLRYRWRHVAVTPCAVGAQVTRALRTHDRTVPAHPCSPTCPVTTP